MFAVKMFMAKMLTAEVPRTEKKDLQNRGMIGTMNQFSGSGTQVVAELEAPQEAPKIWGQCCASLHSGHLRKCHLHLRSQGDRYHLVMNRRHQFSNRE